MLTDARMDALELERTNSRQDRLRALVGHQFRIIGRNTEALIVHFVMPLVALVILAPMLKASLKLNGQHTSAGAELAVPAVVVLFSFVVVGYASAAIFHEQAWHTWERLRASAARTPELVLGKAIPYFVLLTAQMVLIFLVGFVALGMRLEHGWLDLLAVAGAYALCLASFGMLLVSIARNAQQINMITNIGSLLFAALGGAVVPIDQLPRWTQVIAPFVPSYWAVRGFHWATLDDGSRPAIAAGALIGFAVLFFALAIARMLFDEGKQF
jgi:ABC-2 type transport system permease protein